MKVKRLLAFLAMILCAVLFAVSVFAHSGGTDDQGGHYDHDTGEYHFHHGYPAHQHYDGQCPYESVSGNTSSGFNDSEEVEKDWFAIIATAIIVGPLVGVAMHFIIVKIIHLFEEFVQEDYGWDEDHTKYAVLFFLCVIVGVACMFACALTV